MTEMPSANLTDDGATITVKVSLVFRRRGGRKLIIAPDAPALVTEAKVDATLVKAIARAFRWRRLLETGTYATVADLAKSERVNASYVGRIVRLTLLAPQVVEAILDGHPGTQITLAKVCRPFPADWRAQLTHFGLQDP